MVIKKGISMNKSDDREEYVQIEPFGEELPQQIKMPLKLLVLSEFTPGDSTGGPSSAKHGRISIDKDTFGQVMQRIAGKVSFTVPNRLSNLPKEISVTIPLDGIKSFRPDSIAEVVPQLRELMQVRQIVTELGEGKISYDQFQTQLSKFRQGSDILRRIQDASVPKSTPPSSQPVQKRPVLERPFTKTEEKDKSLDSLFDMVEVPGKSMGESGIPSRDASSLLEHFMSLSKSDKSQGIQIDERLTKEIVRDIDSILSIQVNEVIHHPEFRRLEAAWRGLKFLIDRADFREPIQLELLSVAKEALGTTFDTHVFRPEHEGRYDVPVSVILADYEFDRSLQDMELMSDIAGKADMLQVPFISSIGPLFLGLDSLKDFGNLPYLKKLFEQPEYIKWISFRKSNSSRWVTLLFNRFLLRNSYGPDHERVKSFEFRESMSGPADVGYLWGNPVWAMATLLTSSFARTGWCDNITGVRGNGLIEDLPVYEIRNQGGQIVQIPLELFIPEQQIGDFADSGIIALACRYNSDTAFILSAPSAHLPERYPDPKDTMMSAIHSTLPYQIFAGRVSYYAGRISNEIGDGLSPDVIQRIFTELLSPLLSETGKIPSDALNIKVKVSEDFPDKYDVSLIVLPDRLGHYGLAPVELTLRIRR